MKPSFNLWLVNHYAGSREFGMEYRHFFLANHLRRMGHRTSVIAASYHHLYTNPPETNDTLALGESEGVPFAWIRTPRYEGNGPRRFWNMVVFSWRLARFHRRLQKYLGKPDAILLSTPHPFLALNLLRYKRKHEIPVLFEVRDLWPQMLIDLGSIGARHPLAYLFRWLEEIGYRNADRVVSLWHSADEYMLEHGVSADRYVYLPNGIEISTDDHEGISHDDHPLIKQVQARKAKGKFLVGYGGSHGLANPLDAIIGACELLRDRGIVDVEFFLVGQGPEKSRIIERSKEGRLNTVHFHDYVSRSVILRFYREIDVAFMGLRDLPLFRYGPTPNKLMDYLLAGTPIIYGIRSSFNPVEEAGAGITIEPDNPEQLLDAILALKHMTTDQREAMGAAGCDFARTHLDFRQLSRELEGIVHECLTDG